MNIISRTLTMVIAGLLLSSCSEPISPEQKEKKTCEDKYLSYLYAKDFIKNKLKAPSTAHFPSFTNIHYSYQGNCTHRLIGYVDAQNSFGAQIRNNFNVTVRYGKETYYLDSISIE